jgi:CRP/FNR family cyclic AMP-dependent transcriptional regulator
LSSIIYENQILSKFPILFEISETVKYKKGKILFNEGDEGASIYFLLEGVMISYKTSENGNSRIMEIFNANSFIGNITLFNNISSHTLTVEALKPSTVLKINKSKLRDIALKEPELLMHMYQDLAKKLSHTSTVIINNFLSTEGRIISCILNLCNSYGIHSDNMVEIKIDLTQDDLAKFAGTTRVTVTKLLSELTEQGIIRTRPKPWIVYKLDMLQNLLN